MTASRRLTFFLALVGLGLVGIALIGALPPPEPMTPGGVVPIRGSRSALAAVLVALHQSRLSLAVVPFMMIAVGAVGAARAYFARRGQSLVDQVRTSGQSHWICPACQANNPVDDALVCARCKCSLATGR